MTIEITITILSSSAIEKRIIYATYIYMHVERKYSLKILEAAIVKIHFLVKESGKKKKIQLLIY